MVLVVGCAAVIVACAIVVAAVAAGAPIWKFPLSQFNIKSIFRFSVSMGC